MLIRLVGHFIDNPGRIDKLIAIKGLPDEWIFRKSRFGGVELIKPWEPDVEANIPRDCRDLCEPFEITQAFPPTEKGGQYTVDTRIVRALRFDYVTEAGQTMWDQIERYMERTIPRNQMVPKPVLVAPDHKSGYNPQETRRTQRGSLEMRPVESIPVVDLRQPETIIAPSVAPIAAPVAVAPPPPAIPVATDAPCVVCNKSFKNKVALRMHVMKAHPKKEPAGV